MQEGHLQPSYLEQLTLEYALRKHCEKIRKISTLFKTVDTDDDGIINHDQLYVLIEKIEVKSDIDLGELIQILDPFSNNSITYSFLIENLQKIPSFKEVFA